MPTRQAATMIDVATALGNGELGPFPFEQFAVKALAQGDSWFSIGALPPGKTTNLLLEMQSARRMVIVQTARPGKVMRLFTDTTREPNFLRMLNGPVASRWSVILISGEMTWYLSGADGVEQMIPYEAALNDLLLRYPDVTIVCHYDMTRLPGSVNLGAICAHTHVQLPDRIVTGFYRN